MEDSYPISMENQSVCIKDAAEVIKNRIPNCAIYEEINGEIVCIECNSNFYLNLINNTCLEECAKTILLLELEFDDVAATARKKKAGICKDLGLVNC